MSDAEDLIRSLRNFFTSEVRIGTPPRDIGPGSMWWKREGGWEYPWRVTRIDEHGTAYGYPRGEPRQVEASPRRNPHPRNPSTALTHSSRHLSHGFYRVTDAEAKRLMMTVGRHTLPKPGYEVRVILPEGHAEAWLTRTPLSHSAYGMRPPKRGWVWAIYK